MAESSTPLDPQPDFSALDFAQALDQYDYRFSKGQVVQGQVYEYTNEGAYIDMGGKSAGFLPLREVGLQSTAELADVLPLQTELDFLVVSDPNPDGQVTLSRRQLLQKQAWEKLGQLSADGQSTEIRVTGTNRGGIVGDVLGLRGFIPRSHLMERDDLEGLVDQVLVANFLEVDPERRRLVLSQRDAMRATVMSELEVGDLATGEVKSIQPYGVFIDLSNGISGLLHIKQISNQRIESLSSLFEIGQTVKVLILAIDETRGRVSLATKYLENQPGEIVENFEEVMTHAEARANKARNSIKEQQ